MRSLSRRASALRGERLDALIVTGAEPRAPDLDEEPYWRALCRAIDWADANTISTILSCLAAHAGVLPSTASRVEPLARKCSGVFAFGRRRDRQADGLARTDDADRRIRAATGSTRRSSARRLSASLTRSPRPASTCSSARSAACSSSCRAIRNMRDDSLAREYRRDMMRFLRGEHADSACNSRTTISPPRSSALRLFSPSGARRDRRAETMATFPDAGPRRPADAPWRQLGGPALSQLARLSSPSARRRSCDAPSLSRAGADEDTSMAYMSTSASPSSPTSADSAARAPPANGEAFRLAMREFASGVAWSPPAGRDAGPAARRRRCARFRSIRRRCSSASRSAFRRWRRSAPTGRLRRQHSGGASMPNSPIASPAAAGVKGAARFAGADWTTLTTGAPLLRDALSRHRLQRRGSLERHTHAIVIGAVAAVQRGDGRPAVDPLARPVRTLD